MSKTLTGRRWQIAAGKTDLTWNRVLAYRSLWERAGYQLPQLPGRDRSTAGGPGTELKQLLGKIGIEATADCPCHARAAEMDRRGCDWCAENIETILGWLREEAERRNLPFVEFAARQLVKLAIRRARKKTIGPSLSHAQHPLPKHVTRWAVGITTAPRPISVLRQCVERTIATGWGADEITVFADAGVDAGELPAGVRVVSRPETIAARRFTEQQIPGARFGAWGNFVQSMADLLVLHPDAQAIFLIQDDVAFCKGVRDFLEHDLWPAGPVGVVSPYCPNSRRGDSRGEYTDDRTVGCRRVDRRYLIAGQTLIFPRHVAEQILDHPLSRNWKGRAKGREDSFSQKKALDAFVGEVTLQLGLRRYFYNPSLAQHEEPRGVPGGNTTLKGHGRHVGFRRAGRFVGHETDATGVFAGHFPHLRYDQPSGDQRFNAPPSDEELERAAVSVVIPALNSPDLTERCLRSLAAHTHGVDYRVVYVDNGSQSGTIERVQSVAGELSIGLQAIRNETNAGFSKAINQGIRASGDRHVLLLNNDCFLGEDCLRRMLRHLLWHPRTAAVGPLTNDSGNNSLHRRIRRQQAGFGYKAIAGRIDDLPHMASLCKRQFIVVERVLPFFCTLLHSAALHQVGMLDESFESGLAADDDWCLRAKQHGWQSLVVCDAFAAHLHKSTFQREGIDRQRTLRQSHRQLRRKQRAAKSKRGCDTCGKGAT